VTSLGIIRLDDVRLVCRQFGLCGLGRSQRHHAKVKVKVNKVEVRLVVGLDVIVLVVGLDVVG
jgi:hypothetical protein